MSLRDFELYEAIRRDDVAFVSTSRYEKVFEDLLVDDIPSMLSDEPSPLMVAAYFGSLKCFVFLCQLPNFDYRDRKKRHCIHFAAAGGNRDVFNYFLDIKELLKIEDDYGNTPAHYAAKYDRLPILQALLDHKININAPNLAGFTAAHFAASNGSLRTIMFLHESGDTLDEANIVQWVPLHYAIKYHHLDIVDYLIKVKALPRLEFEKFASIIQLAAACNCENAIKSILAINHEYNSENHNNWNLLHFAAANGHDSLLLSLKSFIDEAEFTYTDRNNRTLLHLASIAGHLNVAHVLSEFDLYNKPDKFGKLPLHYAAGINAPFLLQYLVEHTDCSAADKLGQTALHIAASVGNIEGVEILLNHSDLSKKDNKGFTPLHLAVYNRHLEIVEYIASKDGYDFNADLLPNGRNLASTAIIAQSLDILIKLSSIDGFNMFVPDQRGWTLAHYAAQINFDQALEVIADTLGADKLYSPAKDGKTPLHIAALENQFRAVTFYLHDENCDVNVCDNDGNTPIHLALIRGNLTVARELINANADLCIQNKKGQNALHVSIESWIDKGFIKNELCAKEKQKMLNSIDVNGMTPLLLASSLGNFKIVKFLAKNSNISQTDFHHNNALHHAANLRQPFTMNILLHVCANDLLKVRNDNDKTPFDVALANPDGSLITNLLQEHLGDQAPIPIRFAEEENDEIDSPNLMKNPDYIQKLLEEGEFEIKVFDEEEEEEEEIYEGQPSNEEEEENFDSFLAAEALAAADGDEEEEIPSPTKEVPVPEPMNEEEEEEPQHGEKKWKLFGFLSPKK